MNAEPLNEVPTLIDVELPPIVQLSLPDFMLERIQKALNCSASLLWDVDRKQALHDNDPSSYLRHQLKKSATN